MSPVRPYYGWRVVAVAFLMAIFAWGLGFYGPSVFVSELVRTRGWPVSIVSGAVTFHFLFSACLILRLADAYERHGVVAITRAGIIAFGLGIIGWSHAREAWQLYPAAALTGIGWSAMSGAAINAFVSPWFDQKRGIALSHAFNGASMGGVLFTPLWAYLIATYGFQTATLAIAAGGLIVLWPLAGRYFAWRPEHFGLAPDGGPASDIPRPPPKHTAKSNADLLGDWRFVSLSVAFALGIFAQMGLITHLIVRLTPVLGPREAAVALSLATFCAMLGRIAVGYVAPDSRRVAAAANFCLQAVGATLLAFEDTPGHLLAGSILFGLGIGNLLSLPPLILQSEQRPIDVPRALALLTAINQFLYAFAPGALGALRDVTGDYTLPFALVAATQLLSALLVVAVKTAPR